MTDNTMFTEEMFIKAKEACRTLALIPDEAKNAVLRAVADEIWRRKTCC